MARIRVLVVDDSVTVRKVLTDALAEDSAIEVVGTAANGSIALQKIPQVNPNLVILDVEMPGMDGLETVKRLRAEWPRLPVIMCSSLTERGADTTLVALANGASDYITKPTAMTLRETDGLRGFKSELIAKVRALGGVFTIFPPAPPAREAMMPRTTTLVDRVSAVAIGCSTGGPNALVTLFAGLPRDLDIPIFIVQHMPPLFTKLLAERLAASSGLDVTEASDREVVEPRRVYLAPGDFHMTVVREGVRTRIALNKETPENSCRPAVDVLFRSVAAIYGPGVLGAVMTGMGHDGTRGARAIVDAGGSVIVQDAASAVVPSMPGSVAAAGLAAGVYSLDHLSVELVRRIRRRGGFVTQMPPNTVET